MTLHPAEGDKAMNTENNTCHADAQSADASSSAGWRSTNVTEMLLLQLAEQSKALIRLIEVMEKMTAATETQNRSIHNLLMQTAALVETLVTGDGDDDDEDSGVYLDGTRKSLTS